MSQDTDYEELKDDELRDQERVYAFLRRRAALAERIYSQAINSLWLGNSGAALVTLSFIGAAWKNETFPSVFRWPLEMFIVGVIAMGFGTLLCCFVNAL